ncbi:2923_t:CDS:2, partial [Acaulospora colombiana]
AEDKLILLYKKLEAANNDLCFSVLKDAHQSVTKMKDELPELQKLIQIIVTKFEMDDDSKIDGWRTDDSNIDDVIVNSTKIEELRDQPRVNRGKILKKKYLTQDVAQKPLDSCDKNSCKNISMLKLLDDCKNMSGNSYLITEWCEHGNLEEYLSQNPELDWTVKVDIATGIANGLSSVGRYCKVLYDTAHCWLLEFYMMGLDFFGVVLWVIATQERPYKDVKSFRQIKKHVLNGNRPEPIDESIPIRYKEIMMKAWDQRSNYRPKASEMYEKLSKCFSDNVYHAEEEPTNLPQVSDDVNENQRDEAAMYKQAIEYHNNNRREEARLIFCELASTGHKESLYYLGYYHEKGYVVPQDNKKALEYYRESADRGCDRAAYYYAEACLRLAKEYMEKAVQLGQSKSGIKLTEYFFPPPPSQETCDKLLRFLDADESELNRQQPVEQERYQKRIEGLRIKIQQTKQK